MNQPFKPILRRNNSGTQKKRAVRCIETGVVYPSAQDAADILSEAGVVACPVGIQFVCTGRRKSTGGLRWEYCEQP